MLKAALWFATFLLVDLILGWFNEWARTFLVYGLQWLASIAAIGCVFWFLVEFANWAWVVMIS